VAIDSNCEWYVRVRTESKRQHVRFRFVVFFPRQVNYPSQENVSRTGFAGRDSIRGCLETKMLIFFAASCPTPISPHVFSHSILAGYPTTQRTARSSHHQPYDVSRGPWVQSPIPQASTYHIPKADSCHCELRLTATRRWARRLSV